MGLLQRWVARQFTTRVIVLMPVAIAINIVLGYTVQSGLKLPIYMDSIGTILVGVLGGPLPGLITGALSDLIWQYAPGIGSGSQIGPFAPAPSSACWPACGASSASSGRVAAAASTSWPRSSPWS